MSLGIKNHLFFSRLSRLHIPCSIRVSTAVFTISSICFLRGEKLSPPCSLLLQKMVLSYVYSSEMIRAREQAARFENTPWLLAISERKNLFRYNFSFIGIINPLSPPWLPPPPPSSPRWGVKT